MLVMPRLGAGVGGVIFISGSRLPGAGARALLGLFNKHFYEIVRGLAGHDTLVNGPCVMLNDAPSHSYNPPPLPPQLP